MILKLEKARTTEGLTNRKDTPSILQTVLRGKQGLVILLVELNLVLFP